MSKQVGQNTLCVHSAHAPEPATGALSQPIYLTTTFERGADGGYPRGYRYSRERHTQPHFARSVHSGPRGVASGGGPPLPRGSRLTCRCWSC